MAKREVPNLRALGIVTRRKAEDVLEEHGFTLGAVNVTTDNDRDEGISAQVPRGGTQAEEGLPVSFRLNQPTITVDSGMVSMPDLTGMYPEEAEARLLSLGINFDRNKAFREVASSLEDGTVIGHTPPPEEQVKAAKPEGTFEVRIAKNDLVQRRISRTHREQPEPKKPGIVRRIWKADW